MADAEEQHIHRDDRPKENADSPLKYLHFTYRDSLSICQSEVANKKHSEHLFCKITIKNRLFDNFLQFLAYYVANFD
jgi:hypothetical protein